MFTAKIYLAQSLYHFIFGLVIDNLWEIIMKKIFLILLTMCLFLAGCDKTIYHWEFNYGYEEISQVKIVEIIDFS